VGPSGNGGFRASIDLIKSQFEAAVRQGKRERAVALYESDRETDRRQALALARADDLLDVQDLVTGEAGPQVDGTMGRLLRKCLSVREQAAELYDDDSGQMGGRLFTLVIGAVVLGLTIIVTLLMILISGEFAAAIPSNSEFSSAADATKNNGETSFEIMAVATLVVPVIVVVGLLIGAFFSGGGMGGGVRTGVRGR
jgi:hypothetical protein